MAKERTASCLLYEQGESAATGRAVIGRLEQREEEKEGKLLALPVPTEREDAS
jgi:hypothetical protein